MIVNLDEARFMAYITVTYPSGTCTVTHESGTSYSHSGGGTHTFTVGKKGKWFIEAKSSSGVTRTKEVNIATRGQIVNESFYYELILFDGSLASGYSLKSNYISPAIDLTPYNTMEVEATYFDIYGYYSLTIGLGDTAGSITSQNSLNFPINITGGYTTQTLTVTNLKKSMYVGAKVSSYSYNLSLLDGTIGYSDNNLRFSIKRIVLR